jgi:hypothetical protein
MSKGFQGAVVLTQDSVGVSTFGIAILLLSTLISFFFFSQHCSLAAPSICTQKYVRDYFIDGTLPEPGTVCEPVSQPFPPAGLKASDEQAILSATMTPDERELYDAVLELSKSPGIVQLPGFLSSPGRRSGLVQTHCGI